MQGTHMPTNAVSKCVCQSHQNPQEPDSLARGSPTSLLHGITSGAGGKEWSAQTVGREALVPKREGRSLLSFPVLPTSVYPAHVLPAPAQRSLFPTSSAHERWTQGQLLLAPFSLNSFVSSQHVLPPPGDETELKRNLPPLLHVGFELGPQKL